jgi:hypothetical protein
MSTVYVNAIPFGAGSFSEAETSTALLTDPSGRGVDDPDRAGIRDSQPLPPLSSIDVPVPYLSSRITHAIPHRLPIASTASLHLGRLWSSQLALPHSNRRSMSSGENSLPPVG